MNMGPHCLQYRLPKNLSRQEEKTTKVRTGRLRVSWKCIVINIYFRH